ncbi:NAD kinase 2, mitochondrial isoform X2 [Pristis pectinata]|uniref:NAD kinase 2, mitochondrial isoform X2 n=1 Tax=Pristis pectinata TaxID=685728 RepID=UPI00223E76EB|nr:NAD kinase 2, mitochondrial isoform X2 [Pristis pectinata]
MALALLRGGPAAALPAGGWSRLRPRAWSSGPGPFQPQRVVVVAKTTRFEFEQQRSGAAGGGEREAALRQRLATKGSSYCGLLERHHSHSVNVQHVLDSLRKEGIEVRLVKRRDYTEETVRWADAIVSAGGDGTMLLTASKVFGRLKPVIGVNTDPERSQGHLCLPLRYTRCFSDALRKLRQGEFRWQWRQRIRIRLEGVGFNATPVDLHEQQLSLEQHTTAHRKATNTGAGSGGCNGPKLLPVRALNEVFVGESLSSRPSYYEISIDGGPWEKHKNSGLNVCTGTGSRAWSYNINKLAGQEVEDLLLIAQQRSLAAMPLDREFVEQVTDHYNDSLTFSPEEPRIFFSIREPIVNRVFTSTLHRGFTSKMSIRSRCWDACMVVDGGTSFEFNDGAIATLTVEEDDALCTVLLEE